MKFLIIGDLQISCPDGFSEHADLMRKTLTWITQVIAEEKPDAVVHLGDYGESNRGVDHYSLSLMTWFISAVSTYVRPENCLWLVGNHDYGNRTGTVNLMTSLSPLMPGHKIAWPWCDGPGGTLGVSYLVDNLKFRAEMGLLWTELADAPQTLFCHQRINGAFLRQGQVEEAGIDPECLPTFTFVGHYHNADYPLAQHPNIPPTKGLWYCGSPYAKDFRDNIYSLPPHRQTRGVWTAEIVNGRVSAWPKFFVNPFTSVYVALYTDVNEQGFLDPWLPTLQVPLQNCCMRVSVPRGKGEIARKFLAGAKSLTVLEQADRVVSETKAIDTALPPPEVVKQYVESGRQNLGGQSAEDLIQTGCALLKGPLK